ncbi:MAG: hypothetical protein AABM43_08900 [Actinomycetota bacterium]
MGRRKADRRLGAAQRLRGPGEPLVGQAPVEGVQPQAFLDQK